MWGGGGGSRVVKGRWGWKGGGVRDNRAGWKSLCHPRKRLVVSTATRLEHVGRISLGCFVPTGRGLVVWGGGGGFEVVGILHRLCVYVVCLHEKNWNVIVQTIC